MNISMDLPNIWGRGSLISKVLKGSIRDYAHIMSMSLSMNLPNIWGRGALIRKVLKESIKYDAYMPSIHLSKILPNIWGRGALISEVLKGSIQNDANMPSINLSESEESIRSWLKIIKFIAILLYIWLSLHQELCTVKLHKLNTFSFITSGRTCNQYLNYDLFYRVKNE